MRSPHSCSPQSSVFRYCVPGDLMRIITRGDFEGLTSTVLLTDIENIESIRMVHPKDAQDGKVTADAQDIVVNLPYIAGCGLWFDHHASEDNISSHFEFKGRFEASPSC